MNRLSTAKEVNVLLLGLLVRFVLGINTISTNMMILIYYIYKYDDINLMSSFEYTKVDYQA